MKVIIGMANSGKSWEVARIAGEHMNEGVVKIISGDLLGYQYLQRVSEYNKDVARCMVQVISHVNHMDVLKVFAEVITSYGYKAILVDVPVLYTNKDIDFFQAIEERLGIPIYVTIQVNKDSEYVTPGEVRVLDYSQVAYMMHTLRGGSV
jgi:hypothetical protein